MSEFETITYQIENRVATISFNRPEAMNAISKKMRLELKQVIDAAEENDDVRIVVLRAEGKGFSSGTDLTEGLAGFATIEAQILEEYKPVIMGISQSNKPYIASIHGPCAGIGAAVAMACDLAVMSESAFLYLPFAGLSLVPDGGISYHLVDRLGYRKAYQLYLEAARVPASDCLEYGLVNKVVADDQLKQHTQAWAAALGEGAPLAQKFGKQLMRSAGNSSFEEVFDAEAKLQNHCSVSADADAAVKAFFSKQKSVFAGK